MKVKKAILILIVVLAATALVAFFCAPAAAAVTGVCSNCHTMHYSQGGAVPTGAAGGPNSALLLNNCLGCHTTTGSDPFVSSYPYVKLGSASDDNCLAGGFFQTTADVTDDNGNENHDIGATADPAGYDSSETTWYTGATNGLSCAGTNGCHGNETDLDDMAAISGGHHNPTGAYRILSVNGTDVVGYGAADYEELIISTPATAVVTSGANQNVNLYSAGVSDPSISELCAKCHGDFHNESGTTVDAGTSGAWIRHPTDVAIPATWTIGAAAYTPDGDDYKNNPVGYDNATFDITAKRVTCLSCHRAHGTENADLLRWAYSTQVAGGGAVYGCLGCHDAQR
jgi:predicted CXXCH cytochrome family protein